MLETKQLTAAILFFPTIIVNGYRQLFDYQHSSKCLLFQTGLEQLKGEQVITNFSFSGELSL